MRRRWSSSLSSVRMIDIYIYYNLILGRRVLKIIIDGLGSSRRIRAKSNVVCCELESENKAKLQNRQRGKQRTLPPTELQPAAVSQWSYFRMCLFWRCRDNFSKRNKFHRPSVCCVQDRLWIRGRNLRSKWLLNLNFGDNITLTCCLWTKLEFSSCFYLKHSALSPSRT